MSLIKLVTYSSRPSLVLNVDCDCEGFLLVVQSLYCRSFAETILTGGREVVNVFLNTSVWESDRLRRNLKALQTNAPAHSLVSL